MPTPWTIPGADGQPIIGATHLPPDGVRPVGVLVACHGFKGYKDYGFFPYLTQSAAQQGLVAHRFNFSHSGMTDQIDTFARPDLFQRDTWGKQIHDLKAVAGAVHRGELPGAELAAGQLAGGQLAGGQLPGVWFGHSRGGVTVTLTASRLFASDAEAALRPAAVVIAAAPDFGCRLDEQQRALLRREGYLDSPSSRTGQPLRIGRAWLDEIEHDPDAFDPLIAIKSIRCPILIVHGSDDQTVSISAGRSLAQAAGQRARLVEIDGASHTFNAPNPLPPDTAPPPATRQMVEQVCSFALRAATDSQV